MSLKSCLLTMTSVRSHYSLSAVAIALIPGVMGASTAWAAHQTTAQSKKADAAIIATANGWTVGAVVRMMNDQFAFDKLLEDIITNYPNAFSGAVFGGTPNGTSHVYFKGSAPRGVRTLISNSGLRVTTHTNTGKNRAEWVQQMTDLADFLGAQQIVDFTIGFDDVDNIDVVIGSNQQAPPLPDDLADDVTVYEVEGTLNVDHGGVYGGAKMFADGSFECTSSWNVRDTSGTPGTVTAAHCVGVNSVLNWVGSSVPTTWQDQHIGLHGDMEWHTTTNSEPAVFWADSANWRDTETLKVGWAANEWACGYGRSSNNRICDRIWSTYIIMWTASGVSFDLVCMDDQNMIKGDSGGGWSYGTEAIGIHKGEFDLGFFSASHDCFTKAENLDDAMGVDLTLCPVYLDCD